MEGATGNKDTKSMTKRMLRLVFLWCVYLEQKHLCCIELNVEVGVVGHRVVVGP